MRILGSGASAPLACALLLAAGLAHASDETTPQFEEPVRLKAGEEWLGQGRLYPSPALHDLNGDGKDEIVIGDLPGRVTFARLSRSDGDAWALSAEKPLMNADGKPLKFHNW